MPELPEILLRAREIHNTLRDKVVAQAHLMQPKCLNMAPDEFAARIAGERILSAHHHGKWIKIRMIAHHLMLSLGMGGEILYHQPDDLLPDKIQAVFDFTDGSRVSLHFWWFGYIHLVPNDRLSEHKMTDGLGIDALDPAFTPQALLALVKNKRTRIKALLLDQSQIAGVGNMYAHDILFRARLHPLRPANTLSEEEIEALWRGIRDTLQGAVALGGTSWEKNLFGQAGSFGMQHLLVGYKEGQPCPMCVTPIEKLKTGATMGFICPSCQKLDVRG